MNILIEGWRGINHSFSLVNQWQIIELSKSCEIFFKDVPFVSKEWNNEKNFSGLEKDLSDLINNIPKPQKDLVHDITYRISFPFNFNNEFNSKIDAKTIENNKKIKNGVDKFILSVSQNGYGKRSSYLDYRVTNRGGKGIIGIINSPRNGNISSTLVVNNNDEIILSTNKGSIMRCAVKEIRIAGRNTQGVRIKSLKGSEKVVSVIKIEDNII